MSGLKYIAKGANGQVEAYDDKVVITRKGFFGIVSQGIKGDRTIYYSDIKGIEYKKPTFMANGYIQFITSAELANTSSVNIIGGTTSAALKDPNTIVLRAFKKENVVQYESLHNFVMKKFEESKNSTSSNLNNSIADELNKFKKLLDSGIISQEDFDNQKSKLLK
ncbi:MAG: SHOCT domain-containing protein [Lactococcus lactis]